MAETRTAPPDGYKTTVLGPLPEEWEVVRLDDVAQLRSEGMHPEAAPRMPYVGLEHIDPGNNRLRRHGRASEVKSNKSRFFPDDVLYGKLRPYLDKAILARQEGMCSTDILVFAPATNVVPAFLSHLLHNKSFIDHAVATTTGVNHPRTSWSSLRGHLVPLPPLHEQRAIVHMLVTVQQAKETTEQVIASARELKKGLMRHLFTYGPVPVEEAERAPLKETEIGPVPKHWQVMRLEETAKIERGKFAHRPRNDPRFYGGKTPFIQTGDVAKANGLVISYSQTLNELGLSVSRVFPKGTIVLTIAANIGDTGILAFDSAFPDSLVGITQKPFMDSTFLECYLQTQKVEMDRLASRGTQKNINIQFLKPWPILAPPLTEQKEIARILTTVDDKIATEENHKQTLEVLFKTLLHNLTTGKLRVEDATEVARGEARRRRGRGYRRGCPGGGRPPDRGGGET